MTNYVRVMWFQQVDAMCHTAEATIDVQQPVFEDRIISRRAHVVWPPRSCELTPLDYYLCGAIKDKFYADKTETIDALTHNIREATQSIICLKIGPIVQATAWPAEAAIWMKLFAIINRKDCTFK